MSDHAPLAPSSAQRWSRCVGSVGMEAAVPESETDESREGEAGHWVAETLLMDNVRTPVDTVAPNGVVVTDEMIEGATLYAEYVNRTIPETSTARLHVEEQTKPGGIHPLCWGTPDLWCWGENGLDIFDYKFGHLFVEVFEDEQLICYAADIIQELTGLQDQMLPIRFHIIQPRSFHRDGPIRTWATTGAALRPHINRLQAAAAAALTPGAETHTSPSACRDCKARTRCDAFQAASLHAAGVAGSSVPFDLSDAEAGRFLTLVQHATKTLAAMETGLDEQVSRAIRVGRNVPGWQLTQGDAREQWTVPIPTVLELGNVLGINLIGRAVTPSQARKLGLDEAIVSRYSERPKGSTKLVPLDFTQSRKVFAK